MKAPKPYTLTPKPSVVFFGTPEFALLSFKALLQHNYQIAAVVTNPDEPVGRKQVLTPPPVKSYILKHGARNIEILQPHTLDERFKFQVSSFKPDIFIVAAYGKIIPREIIELPRCGVLNIHPSLLPRWRGPSPIQYAILRGDTETGVTIIKMDELMDHGPIAAGRQLANYKSQITNYKTLHDELAKLGAELLIDTLPRWFGGEITPIPQDDSKATYSKILKKDDGRIDWKRPAEEIERMVRAFNPWPGAWTLWPEERAIYRIRIELAEALAEEPPHGSPGYVWQSSSAPLLVKTGKGSLFVKRLTLAGKKPLEAGEFVRGYSHIIGKTLV